MNKQEETTFLKICLQQIENKLGWGDSSTWHNDVFLELSEIIQEKTSVLLSPTTLKRVWGKVNYNSFPSISTLNALTQFIGFDNWRDFKVKVKTKKPSFFQKKVVPYLSIIVPSAAILTLVFISFFSMTGVKRNITTVDYSNIQFSSQPITKGLPNSVVFNFNLGDIQSDSIYIQQFWDRTKTIKIKPQQTQATGIYYYPGYFRSKLLVDGKIIKEHDLFIKSEGWIGTIDYQPIPKFFFKEKVANGSLLLSKEAQKEITNIETPLTSSFHLIDDFGNVSGDNLSIQTKVKNVYNDKWAVCQTLRIVILGSKGAIIIPFSKSGCVSNINLMMNDFYLNGKENDLSAFGVDLSDFKNVSIDIKEKRVTVSVEGKVIYEGNYTESIGKFVGLRYRFLGSGEVEYLNIRSQKNSEPIVQNNFSSLSN